MTTDERYKRFKRYTITLTGAELRGLIALAGEGAEGLLTDAAAARAFIGNGPQIDAARRALDKLSVARILGSAS